MIIELHGSTIFGPRAHDVLERHVALRNSEHDLALSIGVARGMHGRVATHRSERAIPLLAPALTNNYSSSKAPA